jgi:threonine synthase
MDIQVSSNFERLLFELLDRDGGATAALMAELGHGGFALPARALARLRDGFASGRASAGETAATIARVRRETGLVIDPHTAVGLVAAEAARGDPAIPMVTLATAHAAKFPDAVEAACGVRPPLPARLADLLDRPERVTVVPNDLAAIEAAVRERSRA